YAAAGGLGTLLNHFQTTNGSATLKPALRGRLVFASHNPATDASFNEFHLILAGNAMKSFSGALRARMQRLIDESLVRFGFLVLDARETPEGFSGYRLVDRGAG